MTFHSKIDRFYIIFNSIALLVVAIACFFPYFIEEVPAMASVILIGTFVLSAGFLLWMLFDIRYQIEPDHLFVKAGPLKKRIRYEEISRVSPTRDVFTGMRMLSSRDAVEIFYRSAFMGSVKISPSEKERFLTELKKHVPESKFHKTSY
ncbi:PH domain-containing protein [Planococcus sp. CAU13]|uniref:PH domain-containing protein n=1 Tax=Planococcus sp. CAU13 TaxID=1541197 RepID=UPI00052FDE7C|nr:PH domain-containing protein [Planococcus sp. CAU13]